MARHSENETTARVAFIFDSRSLRLAAKAIDAHAIELTLNVDIDLVRHNIGVENYQAFSGAIELKTVCNFQWRVNETCDVYKVVARMLRKLVAIVLRSLQEKAQSLTTYSSSDNGLNFFS